MANRWQVTAKVDIHETNRKKREKAILSALFKRRGLTSPEEIEEFVNPKFPPPPSCIPLSRKSLTHATARIQKAISTQELIVVFGDYDCDGICATAILWETLHDLGANVRPFIPERTEGYGLSKREIEKILNSKPYTLYSKPSLIITVDNGITASEGIGYANSCGIDVIVTDHHLPPHKLPKAYAIVHTTELSGAGIAWLLAQLLTASHPPRTANYHLALVAIATIADLIPLLGANRALTKFGLKALNQIQRVGLKALIDEAGLILGNVGTYEVGWIIAPRINATGRLTSAMDSLRLLCTKDPSRARKLAQRLNEINQKRQKLTEETFNHAKKLITERGRLNNFIFIAHESYHEGVVGLVASKLAEEFHRPAIVVSKRDHFSKGSARSIPAFNIVEAIGAGSHLLEDYGGHPMAAGFTIDPVNLPSFEKKLAEYVHEKLNQEKLSPVLKVDCQINLADITWDLFEKVCKFEPFGLGNPRPLLLTSKVEIMDLRLVGREEKHLKLKLDDPKTRRVEATYAELPLPSLAFDGIGFNLGFWGERLSRGAIVDVVYTIDKNVWNNQETLQLKVKDLRKATE